MWCKEKVGAVGYFAETNLQKREPEDYSAIHYTDTTSVYISPGES
jgi:hypothetical protein